MSTVVFDFTRGERWEDRIASELASVSQALDKLAFILDTVDLDELVDGPPTERPHLVSVPRPPDTSRFGVEAAAGAVDLPKATAPVDARHPVRTVDGPDAPATQTRGPQSVPRPSVHRTYTDEELLELNAEFEHAPASRVIAWAVHAFGPHLCLTASMTDAVLIDLAVRIDPSIEVVFIDTGYHFPETLATVESVRRRYGLNMKIMTAPESAEALWEVDPEKCCSALKVEQLDRALAGKTAWMSGLRRQEADSRSNALVVGRDLRNLVKVNPIATWSDQDVQSYIRDHHVPYNPLMDRGYLSIGCQPCTQPVAPGDDPRSGRWSGRSKTECGLHL